jgi:thioesterase domain-containing protein
MLAHELGQLLKNEIPLAEAMEILDFELLSNGFRFRLPLKANYNHKGTAFGGSLYSAGALACYGLFLYGLRASQITTNDIVISEGTMKYTKPTDNDAEVIAAWPSETEKETFFKTLLTKKKARIQMQAEISVNGVVCATFSGAFVAKI